MTNYIITTSNLTKVYHGTPAVNDLNLAIPKNKVYGLLGANGAGKSTTLKMLTGIIRPTSGEIFFQGKPFKNIRQKIRGYRLDSIETVWGIGYRWKKENPLV